MRIGVLGTGSVGQAIATKLISLGHDVKMGSRTATNEKAVAWKERVGQGASVGTFADAAAYGEILVGALSGAGAIDALKSCGGSSLAGKILVDISNPLDFTKGFPPSLSVCNTDSLGEQIQRTFPDLKVVKTLNTVNAALMVDPSRLHGGDHTMVMCGNDVDAKQKVKDILTGWFGWKDIIDLGDISNARGTEMFLPLWVRLYGVLKTPEFSIKVMR
jgi:hypothetical protein